MERTKMQTPPVKGGKALYKIEFLKLKNKKGENYETIKFRFKDKETYG